MRRYAILRKNYLSFLMYTCRTLGNKWEWILRVWDNGRRSIKLDQGRFIDMGSLRRDSAFNVAAW